MKSDRSAPDEVVGERGATLVNRAASVQSRLSSVLALSLMSFLGIGSLTWYYANSMTRQSRERQSAQNASASHAQGDAALPSIGRIDPPAATAAARFGCHHARACRPKIARHRSPQRLCRKFR